LLASIASAVVAAASIAGAAAVAAASVARAVAVAAAGSLEEMYKMPGNNAIN
jgi:hypothetical protein